MVVVGRKKAFFLHDRQKKHQSPSWHLRRRPTDAIGQNPSRRRLRGPEKLTLHIGGYDVNETVCIYSRTLAVDNKEVQPQSEVAREMTVDLNSLNSQNSLELHRRGNVSIAFPIQWEQDLGGLPGKKIGSPISAAATIELGYCWFSLLLS